MPCSGKSTLARMAAERLAARGFPVELLDGGDRFLEVFTDSSVESCMKRDVKGMHKRALAGEIKQFTGVSDPYERPENPELHLKTDMETSEESLDKLMRLLWEGYGIS